MNKTASELLKEKLIELTSVNTAKETFNLKDFESEAKKVRETFEKENENIQYRKALHV